MATRTKDQNTLSLGDWNALCDVCGFKFKSCDLKKRWDGYMVCKEDWEPKHPSLMYKAPKSEAGIPWSRSDDSGQQANGANTAVTKDGVTASTFPNAENTTATKQGFQPDSEATPDGLVEGDFFLNGEVESGTVSKA